MNCREFNLNIDDYIENSLNDKLAQAARAHIEACTACRHRFENRLQMKKSLAEMPIPKMRDGFADQAIHSATQPEDASRHSKSSPKFRWAFGAGFATAVAAGFAVWFFVNTFSDNKQDLQALNIQLHELKTVKILFESPQPMNNAKVSLLLSENIAIDGYTDKRMLTWSTKLKAGKNVLTLPVRALGVGNGELVTRVEFGGKSKLIRFSVNVDKTHQSKPIDHTILPSDTTGTAA